MFHLSVFLPAPRTVLPQYPSTDSRGATTQMARVSVVVDDDDDDMQAPESWDSDEDEDELGRARRTAHTLPL